MEPERVQVNYLHADKHCGWIGNPLVLCCMRTERNPKYPLEKGLRHVWIGSLPKCGEDAIQVLPELTPGQTELFHQGAYSSPSATDHGWGPLNNLLSILIIRTLRPIGAIATGDRAFQRGVSESPHAQILQAHQITR